MLQEMQIVSLFLILSITFTIFLSIRRQSLSETI